MSNHRLTVIALLVAFLGCPALAAIKDKEQVIDVAGLSRVMEKASAEFVKKMRQSQLRERFRDVNELLEQENVDKSRLIRALQALQSEMFKFTSNWNEATEPLWEAQERIGQTVDRVRMLLARGRGGQLSEKTTAMLANYDARLTNLAKAIKAEQDEKRKAQLKIVFANVIALRKLVSQTGTIDLNPARQAVYAKIVRALTSLEAALTVSSFQLERARILLASEAEFVATYSEILQGVVDAEDLARELARLRSEGKSIGALASGIGDMSKEIAGFTQGVDGLFGKLTANIEMETAKIGDQIEASDLGDIDVDDEIAKYAGVIDNGTSQANKE